MLWDGWGRKAAIGWKLYGRTMWIIMSLYNIRIHISGQFLANNKQVKPKNIHQNVWFTKRNSSSMGILLSSGLGSSYPSLCWGSPAGLRSLRRCLGHGCWVWLVLRCWDLLHTSSSLTGLLAFWWFWWKVKEQLEKVLVVNVCLWLYLEFLAICCMDDSWILSKSSRFSCLCNAVDHGLMSWCFNQWSLMLWCLHQV